MADRTIEKENKGQKKQRNTLQLGKILWSWVERQKEMLSKTKSRKV